MLAEARTLTKEEQFAIKQNDFEIWSSYTQGSFKIARYAYQECLLCHSAFSFHQASENAIITFLLVHTGYKPKTHDLEILRRKVQSIEPSFAQWFDLTDMVGRHHFDLLRRAYIEARYSKAYSISLAELQFIEARIDRFKRQVNVFCQQELARMN